RRGLHGSERSLGAGIARTPVLQPKTDHTGGGSMAETRTNRPETARSTGQPPPTLARRDRGVLASPLDFFDRVTEEMDRVFDRMSRDFGLPTRFGFRGITAPAAQRIWSPRIEASQQGDRFVVRAELPGLKKEDVQAELTDDALVIQGERREEHQEEREGFFQTEREYGRFFRAIPLPDGVIPESAQATFRNGVLEISMQAAPSEANRGRKLEIKEESAK